MSGLGKFLERQQSAAGLWTGRLFVVLGMLVAANFFLRPEEPHFGFDARPLFWPVFGLGVGVVMVLLMKRVVQPLLLRKEDYYDDI